jgi:hypothetical protein
LALGVIANSHQLYLTGDGSIGLCTSGVPVGFAHWSGFMASYGYQLLECPLLIPYLQALVKGCSMGPVTGQILAIGNAAVAEALALLPYREGVEPVGSLDAYEVAVLVHCAFKALAILPQDFPEVEKVISPAIHVKRVQLQDFKAHIQRIESQILAAARVESPLRELHQRMEDLESSLQQLQ